MRGPLQGAHPRDLCILTTFGPELRKTWSLNECGEPAAKNYDDAKTFRATFHRIRDLTDLWRLQLDLQRRPRSACVRAALLENVDPNRCERLLRDRVERDGEIREQTMADVPREHVAFDLDSLDAPDGWHRFLVDFVQDLVERIFPVEFRGAGFVAVASASAGIKPGARLRVWYLLDRPLVGREIERAMEGVSIDPSTLRAVQLIYTAAPRFQGMPDPVAERVAYAWLDRDVVALKVPPERARPIVPPQAAWPIVARDGRGLALHHLADAIRTAPEGSRHRKLFGCAWRAGDLVAAGEATAHEVFHELSHAAVAAGITDPPTELGRIIKSGLDRAAGGAA